MMLVFVLLAVTPLLPDPRDNVPESGTPSPIGNAFEFLHVQYTVGKVTTLPTRVYRSRLLHEISFRRSAGSKSAEKAHFPCYFPLWESGCQLAIGDR